MITNNDTAQALIRLLSIFRLGTGEEILDRVTDALMEHLDADAVAIVVGSDTLAQSGCGVSEQRIVDTVVSGGQIDAPPHVLSFPISNETDGSLVALRANAAFTADESMTARAMVRMMCQATRTADAVDEERKAARRLSEQLEENRALGKQLAERHTALTARLSEIQQLVAAGNLTDEALPSVIRRAGDHFSGGSLELRLRDDDGQLTTYSSAAGFGPHVPEVDVETESDPHEAIAAPVYLRGEPRGELAVSYPSSSTGAGQHDREAIVILAGFLSLALTEMEARREVTLAYDDAKWRATHDLVTGLHNRTSFVSEMDQCLSTGQPITVLYIDLDGFKTINDHYGHATGDRVLVETAERLRSELREGTTLARLAGDEFAILLQATTDDAVATAERLRARLGQPIAGTETETALVTASIGIAHGIPGWTAEDILDAADIAMYSSKQQQRGTVTVFDNSLRMERNRRTKIERRLKAAIPTMEGFHLVFHPTTDLLTGERPSFEALLRWDDAELGAVTPDEFIGIAEQTGLVRDIDSWVISTAIEQIAEHVDDAEIGLSVNLSPASFEHPDLIGMLAEILVRHRFAAHRLTLEITERVLLHDLDLVVPVLDRLHGMGIKIALDDFGAGHSSFAHLQSHWIDVLKIDRSLLPASEHDTRAISILRALRSLCTELDLEVIIEGIDSEFQRSTIRSLGFRLAQGFLWGRPAALGLSLGSPNRHLRPVADERSA